VKPLPAGRVCAQTVLGIKEKKCAKDRFGFVGCRDDVGVVLYSCKRHALEKGGEYEKDLFNIRLE
jgi:hypothetical protein